MKGREMGVMMSIRRILGASGALFLVLAVGASRNAAADIERTAPGPQTNAVMCDLPSGVWDVQPGQGYSHEGVLSGFAGGAYYVTLSRSGNATWNEGLYTYPGFTASNGTQGFFGPSTNLLFSFFVFSNAPPGAQSNITITVIDTAGRQICQSTMTARVPGGCRCVSGPRGSAWALVLFGLPLALALRRARNRKGEN